MQSMVQGTQALAVVDVMKERKKARQTLDVRDVCDRNKQSEEEGYVGGGRRDRLRTFKSWLLLQMLPAPWSGYEVGQEIRDSRQTTIGIHPRSKEVGC